ncbi:MAG: acyl-CoA thioesterase [Planctomycetia bacterium]|nr:acyl-CoA thioesterase [Planctomycetia bacterium]
MLIPIYRKEIVALPEHLDEMHHVNNVWYVRWMQDIAIEHSAVNGWETERYIEHGAAWFVRRHTINYLHPIQEGDVIVAETWVREMKNVTSLRQYRFLRKSDGLVFATAETKWGLVSLKTGRPTKVSPEMLACFLQCEEKI